MMNTFSKVRFVAKTINQLQLSKHARCFVNSHRCSESEKKRADFGFKDVNAEDKERMVKDIFSKVAEKYDVMNDFMSMGAHRLWKDELINMIGYSSAAKIDSNYLPRHLDVAGGTGDVSFRSVIEMVRCFGKTATNVIQDEWTDTLPQADRQIVVCDINPEMLAVGKHRAVAQVGKDRAKLVSVLAHCCWTCIGSNNCMSCSWVLWKATRRAFRLPTSPSICTPSPSACAT